MMRHKNPNSIFSFSTMLRDLQSLGQNHMTIMAISWGVALIMVCLATYTAHLSVESRQDTNRLQSVPSVLPRLDVEVVDLAKAVTLHHQLVQRYPDIQIADLEGNIVISSNDATKFREWVEAIDYMDTLQADWRWSLPEFCVGQCTGKELMYAVVHAEAVSFSNP